MYNLKSKKTGKISVVDKETIDQLKNSGDIKKYDVTEVPKQKTIFPDEIISKKKIKSEPEND